MAGPRVGGSGSSPPTRTSRAIAFYQRRGMEMVALHRNFVDEVRRSKPDRGERGYRRDPSFVTPSSSSIRLSARSLTRALGG